MRKRIFQAIFFAIIATSVTFMGCKDYGDDIDNLNSEVASIDTKYATVSTQIESLQAANTSLTSQLASFKTALEAAIKAGDDEAIKQAAAAKAAADAAQASVNQAIADLTVVKNDLATLKANGATKADVAAIDAKITTQAARISALEPVVASLTTNVTKLTNDLATLTSSVDAIKLELATAKAALDLQTTTLANFIAYINGLNLPGVISQVTNLQAQVGNLQTQVQSLITNGATKADINALTTQLTTLDTTLRNLIDAKISTLAAAIASDLLTSVTFIPEYAKNNAPIIYAQSIATVGGATLYDDVKFTYQFNPFHIKADKISLVGLVKQSATTRVASSVAAAPSVDVSASDFTYSGGSFAVANGRASFMVKASAFSGLDLSKTNFFALAVKNTVSDQDRYVISDYVAFVTDKINESDLQIAAASLSVVTESTGNINPSLQKIADGSTVAFNNLTYKYEFVAPSTGSQVFTLDSSTGLITANKGSSVVNQSADVKITAYIGGTQLASLSKIVRVTIVPKPIETEKSWTWTLNSSSVTSTTATWNILTDLAPALGTTYAEFSAQSPTTVVTLSGSAVSNTGIEFVENPQYTLAIHINLSAASNLQLDKTYVITRTYFNSINGRTLVIKGTVVTKSPEITGINKIDRNWNSSKTIAYVLGQGSPWAPVGDLSSAYDFASASASGIGSVSFSFVKTNTAVSDYSVASSGAIQLLANQSGYLEGAQYAKVTLNASATVGGRLFTWPVPSQGFDVQFIRPLSVQKLAEASIEKNATSTSGNLLTYIKLVDERDGSNTSVAGITSKYQVTKIEAIGYDATLLTIAPATSANGFNPSIVLTNGYLANTSDITVEANVRVTYLNGGAMHTAAGILKVVVKARN